MTEPRRVPPFPARYLVAIHQLPEALRVRRPLEEEVTQALEAGRHICIRGFWRIGKTELMKAALSAACERTGGSGFVLDLRDEGSPTGLPQSAASVLERVAQHVEVLLGDAGKPGPVDRAAPLEALRRLEGRAFVGFDELIALQSLGEAEMTAVIRALTSVPENVRVLVVCHRHRKVDGVFEREIVQDPRFSTWFIPPLTPAELAHIVRAPAREQGVEVTDAALEALGQLTGFKPWEAFTFCYLATSAREEDDTRPLDVAELEELMSLERLTEEPHGRAMVENCVRILASAMTPEEREVMELLACGGEGRVSPEVVEGLERAAWLGRAPQWHILGELFAGLVRGVASGAINVRLA